ncbi:ATP-dependent DNA ligase [Kitasatospora cheerisanensis KCTC 2395]|uniref:DNA ligase (ATP) n=1 Tax=Kitasatospora cheerisanensis KCTC 2395 TaxID=1348663 RepID=A0A066YIF4_9ACTN|nr:ATP-dependent DNA ligase [Kitasatospora cheerisanensis KCTC 2395]
MGRVPGDRVPGRRRDRARVAHREAADQVLPRGGGGCPGAAARAVRGGRGDRRRARRAAALRGVAGADPPGRVQGPDPRRADARLAGRLRPARPRRRRPDGPSADRASRRTRPGPRGCRPPVHLAPATTDLDTARAWFSQFEGAGLDGVVAKPLDAPYRPGERTMFKVKHVRTADCVVAGYREHKSGPVVGSLLLGLYDDGGRLQHVGVSASFPMARRAELAEELAPLRLDADDLTGHPWAAWADEQAQAKDRLPGAVSRWTGKKDLSWVPLRPERVCEVGYDHMEGTRFRHTTQFKRWRPDRTPESCTYAQLEEPVSYDLGELLA